MHTRVEEQGTATDHKSQCVSGVKDDDQLVRCRVGWSTSEQSGQRQRQRVLDGLGLVDVCCCTGNIYEFNGKTTLAAISLEDL
jgi:hypothetical protein